MPLALIIIGLTLVVTGAQNTHGAMGAQLRKDLTGTGGFLMWIAAILGIGAIGYVDQLRPISRAFMVLIFVGILIANPKFFSELTAALKDGPISPAKGPVKADPDAGQTLMTPTAPKSEEIARDRDARVEKNLNTVGKLLKMFMGAPAF